MSIRVWHLSASVFVFCCLMGCGGVPTNNPASRWDTAGWTDDLPWATVIDIRQMPGQNVDEQLAEAQRRLAGRGGVVYFPAGEYHFADHVRLADGVILRGQEPAEVIDARREDYRPATVFRFPRYRMVFRGEPTPNTTAFKGIGLADPGGASNCGLVHLTIDHGHIELGAARGYRAGRNRLVIGCRLTNAARLDGRVPDLEIGQHPWQRFPARHEAAIEVHTESNALVANNRLAPSDGSFAMPGYLLQHKRHHGGERKLVERTVRFDYDNRPGIAVNVYSLGGRGGRDPKATPETFPPGFRKGIVITSNFVYSTGRNCIAFSGDGTVCSFNKVRMVPDLPRHTHTGRQNATGSSTNSNRAMMLRGWRYTVEGNDLTSYRNRVAGQRWYINDGEGIMHEGHANSTIRDSRIINNTVNAYLSIYKTAGIDGLEISGNRIVPQGPGTDVKIPAIFVDSDRNWDRHFIRNVRVIDNETSGKILVRGAPAEDNVVRGNRFIGDDPGKAVILNAADARVGGNEGFRVETVESDLPLADPDRPSAVYGRTAEDGS